MKKHDHEWGEGGHCVHCGAASVENALRGVLEAIERGDIVVLRQHSFARVEGRAGSAHVDREATTYMANELRATLAL